MGIRQHCFLLGALLLVPVAGMGQTSSPAPAAAVRPTAQIPAAKLATLRALADLTMNYGNVRQGAIRGAQAHSGELTAALEKQGLSAARAQEFSAAFYQEFTRRINRELTNDALIQMLDGAFSEDEAAQLLAFCKTPVGQKFVGLEPQIVTSALSQVQQEVSSIAEAVSNDVHGSFPELNSDTAAPKAGELPRPTQVENDLYPPVSQGAADLAAAERRAAASGHHLLVVFGANWCYDCHVLDTALHSAAFTPLMASYETVNINVGDKGMDNLGLARKLGVNLDKGVPALAVLDAHGAVLVAQKQSEFESTRTLQGSELEKFLQTWRKP